MGLDDDIWRVEFDRDMGAQLPVLPWNELGRRALKAWCSAPSDDIREAHATNIRAYWTPNSFVTESESANFREYFMAEASKHPDNAALGAFLASLFGG